MSTSKILIVAHKEAPLPTSGLYAPIFVNKHANELQKKFGGYTDNTGQNIADKNPYYSELTAMYWIWKNLQFDYVGLVHYRRFFAKRGGYLKSLDKILKKSELDQILTTTDLILPKKRYYFIETMWDHYVHTLYPEPLEETEKIIAEKFPDYAPAFKKLKTRRSGHMFNMLIAKKDLFNEYCEWLFAILFELEKRIDPKKYDAFHARFFGRISELLLDVFVETKGLSYVEVPFAYTEKPRYAAKILGVLRAKFGGQKYGKSF